MAVEDLPAAEGPAPAVVPAPEPAPVPVQWVHEVPTGPLPPGAGFAVGGWAIGPAPAAELRVLLDGKEQGSARLGLPRPDVAAVFPAHAGADACGYWLAGLDLPAGHGEEVRLTLRLRLADGSMHRMERRLATPRSAAEVLRAVRGTPRDSAPVLLDLAAAFARAGKPEEAEALVALAMARDPDHGPALALYARLAADAVAAGRGDPAEAARRMARLSARFPALVPNELDQARTMLAGGRLLEADVLLDAMVRRQPEDPAVLLLRAVVKEQLAGQARNEAWVPAWHLAMEAWDAARAKAPADMDAVRGSILSRLQANRIAAAEALAMEAVAQFPEAPELAVWPCHIARVRGDLPVAATRLATARIRFPGHLGLAAEEQQLRFALAAEQLAGETARPPRGAGALTDRDLALKFEALGVNCEFGMVQRSAGAEPLGLFRFTWVDSAAVTRMLEEGLEGVGDAATTAFELGTESRPEYYLVDRRHGLRSHTFFFPEGAVPEEEQAAMLARHCKRLQFLRRKLLEDLTGGEKVFVHATYIPLAEAERAALFRALQRYGRNPLLYVVPADAAQPSGTLEMVEPGLMVGRIDGFMGVDRTTVNYRDWLALLRSADAAAAAWRAG